MDFRGNLFILLFNNIPLDEGNIFTSPCNVFLSSKILEHCRFISIRFWKGCTWASTSLRKRLRMVLTNVLILHLLYSPLYFCCILVNLIFVYLTMFFLRFQRKFFDHIHPSSIHFQICTTFSISPTLCPFLTTNANCGAHVYLDVGSSTKAWCPYQELHLHTKRKVILFLQLSNNCQ